MEKHSIRRLDIVCPLPKYTDEFYRYSKFHKVIITGESGDPLKNSRRRFLTSASLGVVGATIGAYEVAPAQSGDPPGTPPGAPSAFATSPPVGPEVSATTFAEAEKLMQVELSNQERHDAA